MSLYSLMPCITSRNQQLVHDDCPPCCCHGYFLLRQAFIKCLRTCDVVYCFHLRFDDNKEVSAHVRMVNANRPIRLELSVKILLTLSWSIVTLYISLHAWERAQVAPAPIMTIPFHSEVFDIQIGELQNTPPRICMIFL